MSDNLHEVGALSPLAAIIIAVLKVGVVFAGIMTVVALFTLVERRVSAFIQDRLGPNRVGPFGLLQPVADGLKNFFKEETYPATASKLYFVLAPMMALVPALVTFAVIPFAAPLPTPWGLVEMVIADVPIGVLYILAFSSLAVYGVVIAGWASNNKYSFLGGLRAGAQMISYEVSLGFTLLPIFFLAGNVTLTKVVWLQQGELGIWLALPLSLAFILFVISTFAETNRLPFDMPEAEAELVAGYHTEYSSMKFSVFLIAEYAHMLTASALMATLFLGGWDIPFWRGDHMVVVAPGVVMGAEPAWWKTLLTLGSFGAKTIFFMLVFVWVRWTLPRFRYDQVMHVGWKVVLPVVMGYIVLMAFSILLLDSLGVEFGLFYGLVLTFVSLLATGAFLFVLDRDRVVGGAGQRPPVIPAAAREGGRVPQAPIAGLVTAGTAEDISEGGNVRSDREPEAGG